MSAAARGKEKPRSNPQLAAARGLEGALPWRADDSPCTAGAGVRRSQSHPGAPSAGVVTPPTPETQPRSSSEAFWCRKYEPALWCPRCASGRGTSIASFLQREIPVFPRPLRGHMAPEVTHPFFELETSIPTDLSLRS